MFRKYLTLAAAAALLFTSAAAWSYDESLAASYARLFSPVMGEGAGKALHLMTAEAFLNKVRMGDRVVTLDIRTPAETCVFTTALANNLVIPLNELFIAENLARIPVDTPVLVLCKSGTRATAAGTALRHIGFDNVFILKGGFKALNDYLDAKTANSPPAVAKGK